MTRHLRALTLAASAIALLGLAAPASAATESFSHVITPQTVPFTIGFTLPSFDPAMGTLTAATITTTASGTATLSVINANTASESFTNGQASFPFTVTGPAATTVATTGTTPLISGTAAPAPSAGSFSVTNFTGNAVTGTSSVAVAQADLGSYVGNGGVPASFSAAFGNGTYTGSGPTGLFFGGLGLGRRHRHDHLHLHPGRRGARAGQPRAGGVGPGRDRRRPPDPPPDRLTLPNRPIIANNPRGVDRSAVGLRGYRRPGARVRFSPGPRA